MDGILRTGLLTRTLWIVPGTRVRLRINLLSHVSSCVWWAHGFVVIDLTYDTNVGSVLLLVTDSAPVQ